MTFQVVHQPLPKPAQSHVEPGVQFPGVHKSVSVEAPWGPERHRGAAGVGEARARALENVRREGSADEPRSAACQPEAPRPFHYRTNGTTRFVAPAYTP